MDARQREAQAVAMGQLGWRLGSAMPCDVFGARAHARAKRTEPDTDQGPINGVTLPQGDVHLLANQVDDRVREVEVQVKTGMPRVKFAQERQDELLPERHRGGQPDQPASFTRTGTHIVRCFVELIHQFADTSEVGSP
ncbi:hypothetical protein ASC87_28895 [Rhizobacter sp. Root1221]|nr:hypothetical protein ASC87_28895 [Rhizobacter sp. Root1221]